ncbi:FtsK/SpoIIIE domain-containing protein [Streptomyces sp. GSL17-111]|uniref:FtsK/SpoIIIE domain-containing protein n=1 Tax=Streptomyces sp. GSL17-111 TaxID=3121596 RepID=UPI0030F3EA1F
MDRKAVWSKIAGSTKTARLVAGRVNTATVRVLDAAAPACAPLAARWDAEADRRRKLRTPEHLKALMEAQRNHTSARALAARARADMTRARKDSHNPLAAARRAARVADKAARKGRNKAKGDLKSARKQYPATLATVATWSHAGHAVPAGAASYAMASPWPVATSAALIAGNAAAVLVGRRQITVMVDDEATAEERQLMERLDPSWWVQHAGDRGLSGTVTTPPAITPAGIVAEVRLDGAWTVEKLKAAEAQVRALLGARTALPMRIQPGTRGGWATLTLRTRSAADGANLAWTPGAAFGVDTITGEDVRVPLGQRMLIAGRSGSGKSWSARPLLHDASEGDSHRLVIIDLKQVEGRLWDHRARVATTPDEVVALVAELVAEMTERLSLIPKGEDTLTPTPERPRITVFVDEGGEVTTAAKEALPGLESLARMGRAPIIDLWWATQKPTMSGSSPGIPSQIAPQLSTVVSLAVSTPTEARTVLGEDAQARGWHAESLPAPGYALVRSGPDSKPHPVRTRALSPREVVALPDRPVWRRESAAVSASVPVESARPTLTLVKDPAADATAASVPAPRSDAESAVLDAVRAGATRQKQVVEASGLAKGTVSKAVGRLVERGELLRAEDGSLSIAAGEVSA